MPKYLISILSLFLFTSAGISFPLSGVSASEKSLSPHKVIKNEEPQPPVADAGRDTTLYYPINVLNIDGSHSHSNDGILYSWKKISGPSSYLIKNPTRAITEVRSLVPGTYLFELVVSDFGHRLDRDTVSVTVLPDNTQPGDVPYNANTYTPPYTGTFQYGTNPSSYGNGWNDTSIASIAEKAGVHSLRLPLPDYFVGHYGYDARLEAFGYYTRHLGMKEITLFAERPRPEYEEPQTHVFKNLYKPIWDKGENGTPVNEDNYFALYIYKLVKWYGKDIKFWEIVNEPDITGFWDNGNKSRTNNWWDNPPQAYALLNLKAPIFSYIRMLRIAYEVIKKYYPDSYVAPGGIGYPAFLDALLRYTDNPDGGKVTPKYPLTGGAYFDVVSYHIYPAYNFQKWDNAIGGFKWSRYSDKAANALIDLKEDFKKVLLDHGYNGKKYPKKLFILTETNMARKTFGTYWGTEEAQRNFIIKALVKAQENNIKQLYTFVIGEFADYNSAKNANDLMGLYENLKRDKPGQEKLTSEGKAYKTTSMLLYGWKYDSIQTKALNLPEIVDGAAFKKGKEYRYVLWAKTHTDESEKAMASYSFPKSLGLDSVYCYEWNYSVDPDTKKINAQKIELTGVPLFFTGVPGKTTINKSPVANAGKNQTITLPTNTVTLDGAASSDPDGEITNYHWKKKSGPDSYTFDDNSRAKTTVSNLKEGTYIFTLTVTDDAKATASADVKITVKKAEETTPSNEPPVAKAGSAQTITLPTNTITLDGTASSDPEGNLTSYQWVQTSGPSSATIISKNTAKTRVENLVAGTYVFTLTVKDKEGASSSDQVTIKVNSNTYTRAIANAGVDRTIILPKDTIVLDGTATTGTVTNWYWSKEGGPKGGGIKQMGSKAIISDLHPGTYNFYLTVNGPVGWPSSDKVVIAVKEGKDNEKPKGQRAMANAGKDRVIILPKDTVILDGSATTGTVTSWYWSKQAGPKGGRIDQKGPKAIIHDLHPGTYTFYLTTSGPVSWPSSDKVTITVKEAQTSNENKRSIANAGKDRTIILPKDTIILNGSSTSGTVTSWYWSKEAGPKGGSIKQLDSKAIISNLQAGVYDFYLTVTGKVGWPSSDKVVVTVKKGSTTYSRKTTNSADEVTKDYSSPSDSGFTTGLGKTELNINEKLFTQETQPAKSGVFNVYPNPVHNHLNIVFNKKANKKAITCRIVDVHGRVIKIYYPGKIQKAFTHSIDVSNLSNGMYFIQVISGDKIIGVQKIIKF